MESLSQVLANIKQNRKIPDPSPNTTLSLTGTLSTPTAPTPLQTTTDYSLSLQGSADTRELIEPTAARRLRWCGVPEEQRGATFDAFDLKGAPGAAQAWRAARTLAEGKAPFHMLLLYGKTGVGKTHLLYAAAMSVCQRGVGGRFMTVGALVSELRRRMNREAEDKEAAYESYWQAVKTRWPFLALDGIGDTQGTTWQWAVLDELVDARYANKLPLIASANVDLTTLEEKAPRLLSRFRDRVQSRLVLIEALDYRLKKGLKGGVHA